MKYLTSEWYELCQKTSLHFGMRVHKGAIHKAEAVYQRLRKRKEKVFIEDQREWDLLRSLREQAPDGHIHESIDKYKKAFSEFQEIMYTKKYEQLPATIQSQIADPRMFALGYCTKEVKRQLKRLSLENDRRTRAILEEFFRVQKEENIPEDMITNIGFHDCEVASCQFAQDIAIQMEASSGYTDYNRVIFHEAKVIKQEESLVGSTWLYNELYRNQEGYEVHVLFLGPNGYKTHEFTLSCKDITFHIV
ncbi:DUF4085 family protein [Fusibacter ferrireducens]|uniref:DUF4085 family protein n=1 Tax=Fusibacter ferrireducens TaxID=2785058 RepID=A0ABR9ZQ37_9FIRM|nr:DUF4085 family protein [Fusibacter ferrireducens]MBF4692101.1 DUF4085 family protein [Fusibacter ferrireducens]